MDFALSTEQEALAASERAWLNRNDPILARRPQVDDGPAGIQRSALAHVAEAGFVGLLTDQIGGTHVDLAVLVEEHGRAGSSVPLAELALATAALEPFEQFGREVASSTAGDEILILVTGPIDGLPLRAERSGTQLRITGTTAPAPGILDADGFVIVARSSTERTVIAYVAARAEGVIARAIDTLDLTRGWGRLDIDVTIDATRWAEAPGDALAAATDALACYRQFDALGAADNLLQRTVEYAGQRTQFGAPIGSFQAVKHHCSNMAMAVESARAALWAAAVALDNDDPDYRAHAVSAAAAYSGEATSTVAQTALQVHGGIGFTWEHDLHLLIRRIKVDELLDGPVSYHRRRLVTT